MRGPALSLLPLTWPFDHPARGRNELVGHCRQHCQCEGIFKHTLPCLQMRENQSRCEPEAPPIPCCGTERPATVPSTFLQTSPYPCDRQTDARMQVVPSLLSLGLFTMEPARFPGQRLLISSWVSRVKARCFICLESRSRVGRGVRKVAQGNRELAIHKWSVWLSNSEKTDKYSLTYM